MAHILRKYNPNEWGGTETAVKGLTTGLREAGAESVVYCPALEKAPLRDPLADAGAELKRYRAFLPMLGLTPENREALLYTGGNLMSFDLLPALLREPKLSVIHTHCTNRIGGIGLTAARLKGIPLVVSIHGGALSLPQQVRDHLAAPMRGSWDWGRFFGVALRSRRVLELADAIIVFNPAEAELLQKKFPRQRVLIQPHGVSMRDFNRDARPDALREFPALQGRKVLLMVGRIDAVKNHAWVIRHAPELVARHPDLMIVLAGSPGGAVREVKQEICRGGLKHHVLLTGALPPGNPCLTGLFQLAAALVLPSLSETFGLVILEAWAAGIPVIASETPGAMGLVQPGQNGWLFNLNKTGEFESCVEQLVLDEEGARAMGKAGRELVAAKYDSGKLAAQVKDLYCELIKAKS